jgi:hypothetical protein
LCFQYALNVRSKYQQLAGGCHPFVGLEKMFVGAPYALLLKSPPPPPPTLRLEDLTQLPLHRLQKVALQGSRDYRRTKT